MISLQYGGSKAHHAAPSDQKKGVLQTLPELLTGIKRHLANNFTDPQKQNICNLFLGIYEPREAQQPLWEISDEMLQLGSM